MNDGVGQKKMNDGVGQKKMNDGRTKWTTWMAERNDKTKVFFKQRKKNKMFESSERTWKNEGFYWTNDFIERTVLLNGTVLLNNRSVRKRMK